MVINPGVGPTATLSTLLPEMEFGAASPAWVFVIGNVSVLEKYSLTEVFAAEASDKPSVTFARTV